MKIYEKDKNKHGIEHHRNECVADGVSGTVCTGLA